MAREKGAYRVVIERIFKMRYKAGARTVDFTREDIERVASRLGVLPKIKNLGDVVYSYRFRNRLPAIIRDTAPKNREWVIRLAGRAKYRFSVTKFAQLIPSEGKREIMIPDATPEIISRFARKQEQSLLAKVRYNRLVDIFLGVTAYSLQSHLRTKLEDFGQIETDEIYVGVNKSGRQFIIPVQAKGGRDRLGIVQIEQDYYLCVEKYSSLVPRLVAVQFQPGERNVIVMFELRIKKNDLQIVDEKHYRLVPYSEISEVPSGQIDEN